MAKHIYGLVFCAAIGSNAFGMENALSTNKKGLSDDFTLSKKQELRKESDQSKEEWNYLCEASQGKTGEELKQIFAQMKALQDHIADIDTKLKALTEYNND
jgi:CHAD domain-containing protein